MSLGELACSYATLILCDDGIPVTAEKINKILKAANIECESYWPGLFAKLAEKKNIEDLIVNVGVGGVAPTLATSVGGGAVAAIAPPPEEKKEELIADTDEDIGIDLFD